MFSDAIAFRYRRSGTESKANSFVVRFKIFHVEEVLCNFAVRYRRPVLLCPHNGIIKRVRVYPLRRDEGRPRSVRNLTRTDVAGALSRAPLNNVILIEPDCLNFH